MENRVGESSATAVDGGGGAKDSGSFECNICLELAQDPVVTLCGHLFCWPCLYEWLHVHAHSRECPVCKAGLEEEKLVPLYGRGKASTDPRSRSVAGVQIPSRRRSLGELHFLGGHWGAFPIAELPGSWVPAGGGVWTCRWVSLRVWTFVPWLAGPWFPAPGTAGPAC
uniref:E3 ubiquitin-protein ligase RMA n=1 Tax=Oryza barthii TaxID=65489 RepID=A0A0D3EUF2_9ORYZ